MYPGAHASCVRGLHKYRGLYQGFVEREGGIDVHKAILPEVCFGLGADRMMSTAAETLKLCMSSLKTSSMMTSLQAHQVVQAHHSNTV